MAGVLAGRWVSGRWVSYGLVTAALFALLAPRAGAIEVLDGRIQAHGFAEMQIRGMSRDFQEELDLVQWWSILNVEIEFDIAPDGFGPIDLLEAFVRVEGRYDCVPQQWGHCNMFPSVNTYGNDAKHLPERLRDGIDPEYGGSIFVNEVNPAFPDNGPASFQELPQFKDWFEDNRGVDAFLEPRESDPLRGLPGFEEEQRDRRLDAGISLGPLEDLAAYRGAMDDDPARYTFDSIMDFQFAIKSMDGAAGGANVQNFLMGPWLPENHVEELAVLRDLANPLRGRDAPVLGPPEQRTRFFGLFEDGDEERGPGDDPDPRLMANGGYLGVSQLGPLDPPYPIDPAYVNVTEVVEVRDVAGALLYTDIAIVRRIEEEARLRGIDPADVEPDWPSAQPDGPYEIFDIYVVETLTPPGTPGVGKREQAFYVYLPDGPDMLRVDGDPDNDWVSNWNGLADPSIPPFSDRYIFDVTPVVPIYKPGGDIGFGGDFSSNVSYAPASDAFNEFSDPGRGTDLRTGLGPYCSGPGLDDPIRCPNGREPEGRSVLVQNAIDGIHIKKGMRPFSNSLLTGGMGELPLRPAPDRSNRDLSPNPGLRQAQGLYVPSAGLLRALAQRDLDPHGMNLSESERAWNHGQSQDTKELKEAYFDIELLESRLWARLGLQTIIWGKTEVFPTTDQFNPLDFAIGNPGNLSLEETRIALWAARFVYSLYDVGPFEDVRLEAALNIDDFEPNDLGACGEAFTLDAACQIPIGLLFHGQLGVGLAGVDRPPDPWDDAEGLEGGVRVEWRWDRFSFAVMDFYGFNDMPYPDPIFFYERNVDLATGRPVVTRFAGGNPGPQQHEDCLTPSPGSFDLVWDGTGLRIPIPGVDDVVDVGERSASVALGFDDPRNPGSSSPRGIGIEAPCLKAGGEAGFQGENAFEGAQNALYNHYANQQLYAVVCSATIGASKTQRQACALNLLNSPTTLSGPVDQSMVEFVSTLAAGDVASNQFIRSASDKNRKDTDQGAKREGPVSPMRPLNRDRGPMMCDPGTVDNPDQDCIDQLEAGGGWDGIITAADSTFNAPDPDGLVRLKPDGGTRNCRNRNLDVCREYSFHYDPGRPEGPQGDFLTLDSVLSNQQKALLGCGPFFGTRCDSSDAVLTYDTDGNEDAEPLIPAGGGIDLLNADASFIAQSWMGIEGSNELTPSLVAAFEEAEIGRQELNEYCQGEEAQVEDLACKFLVLPEGEGENRFGTPLQPTPLTTATSQLQPQTFRLVDQAMMAYNAEQPCSLEKYERDTENLSSDELRSTCQGIRREYDRYLLDKLPEAEEDRREEAPDGSLINTVVQRRWREPSELSTESVLQDETGAFEAPMADNAQPCTVFDEKAGEVVVLPGCRGIEKIDGTSDLAVFDGEITGGVVYSREKTRTCAEEDIDPDDPMNCLPQKWSGWTPWVNDPDVEGDQDWRVATQNRVPTEFGVEFQKGYRPSVDGCVFGGGFVWDEDAGEFVPGYDIGGIPTTVGGDPGGLELCRKPPARFVRDGAAATYQQCVVPVDPVNDPDGPRELLPGCVVDDQDSGFTDDDYYTFLYGSNSRTWTLGVGGENFGTLVAGAQPLFHPLAGCLSDEEAASLYPSVTGALDGLGNLIERGNVCEFNLRDFASELSGEGLDRNGRLTGRGPENVFLFRSEGAALSFNAQMFLVWTSCFNDPEVEILEESECFDPFDAFSPQRCSFSAPQFCKNVKSLFGAAGLQRNTVRAGGSNGKGRRTFVWQSGGEAVLSYTRRNVLGFSTDFTEDITKTNWGVEFTWMNHDMVVDADSPRYVRDVQLYHLTVSVDRPTFINFLNPNRTFFMNTQWFFQYVSGYRDSFQMNGPLNVLATFAVFTGYYQDRLLPKFVAIYDFNSRSGGFLPQVRYRFTEALSAELGVSLFIGHTQLKDLPIQGIAPVTNRAPPHEYQLGVDNMLSNFRARDEIWLRLQWTF